MSELTHPVEVSTHPETPSGLMRMEFGPLTVSYEPGVLVPRPWTLLQSTWAAELARTAGADRLVELCAGVGHIGLAAAVLADLDLVQVEADVIAAHHCRVNAIRAGHGARTDVRLARLERALSPEERFPLLIADPPYLPSAQVGQWPDDPLTAIDGGADGLRVIEQCLLVAADHVEPDGTVLLQTAGAGQAAMIADLVGPLCDGRLVPGEVRAVDDERAVLLLHRR